MNKLNVVHQHNGVLFIPKRKEVQQNMKESIFLIQFHSWRTPRIGKHEDRMHTNGTRN